MSQDLTTSQRKALREIIAHVRRERFARGTHLSEWTLAKLIGTSRSPVRVALDYLVDSGLMRYDRNRGYSLDAEIDHVPQDVLDQMSEVDDPLYLRLADARFQRTIPESVTEADLTRLLEATRAEVRKTLVRAQSEGWVEKGVGYGWHFLPMIDSLEAYDDMYALRLAIEPAGILSAKFHPDMIQLRELRREQEAIQQGGYKSRTTTERFASNARFHETIAEWSGNLFAVQTLRRLDQMRRLAEYRKAKQQIPLPMPEQEHLQILDAIEAGDNLGAASLMKQHIEAAWRKRTLAAAIEWPVDLPY